MTRWQLRRAWLTGSYGMGVVTMTSFLVPLRASELGASIFWVGIVVGVPYAGPQMYGSAIAALMDRLGARRAFQLSAAATVVTSTALAVAGHWWIVFAVMVAHVATWFAGWASSQAYIATLQDDPDLTVRNASRYTFVGAVLRAAAPLLAAGAADWYGGLRFGFWAMAAYSALCLVLGLSLANEKLRPTAADAEALKSAASPSSASPSSAVPSAASPSSAVPSAASPSSAVPSPAWAPGEGAPGEEPAPVRRNAFALLRNPRVLVPLMLAFGRVWIMVICTSFYALLLVERGFSKTMASLVIATIGLAAMATTLLVTQVARSMSKQILAGLAIASCGVGFLLVPFDVGAALAFVPAILVGIAEGVTMPLVIAILGEEAETQPQGVTVNRQFSLVGTAEVASLIAPTFMGLVSGLVGLTAAFPVRRGRGAGTGGDGHGPPRRRAPAWRRARSDVRSADFHVSAQPQTAQLLTAGDLTAGDFGVPAAHSDLSSLTQCRNEGGSLTRWQLRRAWLTGGYGFGVVVMDSFLVPLRARELGASLFWIGIILGLPVVGSYVFGSAIGDLTNRLGVRRTFQLAAAGTVVTSAAMALAGHWWVLLMVQVMHRWLWFAGWISSQAYIATLQDDPDLRVRNAGRFTSVGAVCRAAAPLLAAVVADWHGLRFGFLVVAAYSALCCALGLSLASHRASRPTADAEALESAAETLSEGAPSEAEGAREEREEHALGGRNTFALTRKAGTVVPFFLAFCWIWVMVICTSFYGLLLVERGFSKIMASVVIGCIGVSAILTSLLVTKVARSMSNQILAGLVLASCGAGFMLVPIVVNAVLVLLVFLPAILAGVAEGITSPLVIAIVGEDAEARPEGVTAARRFSAVGNAQLASWAAPTFMGLVSGLVGLTAAFPFAGAVVLGLVGTAMAHHGIGRLLGDGPASLFALLLAMLRNSLRRRR